VDEIKAEPTAAARDWTHRYVRRSGEKKRLRITPRNQFNVANDIETIARIVETRREKKTKRDVLTRGKRRSSNKKV